MTDLRENHKTGLKIEISRAKKKRKIGTAQLRPSRLSGQRTTFPSLPRGTAKTKARDGELQQQPSGIRG